jgi:serine/threonine protein kinase
MEYLHIGCYPGIVHRDLKTTNILLDSNMRGKIADFGLSRAMVDGAQLSGGGCGTVGYMDP